jgi:catechol 2,3-dioxygenase-like lactoylglutathione lyase family enzyme
MRGANYAMHCSAWREHPCWYGGCTAKRGEGWFRKGSHFSPRLPRAATGLLGRLVAVELDPKRCRSTDVQTRFGHILFNVQAANLPFYKDLLALLGWQTLFEGEGMLGAGEQDGGSIWFASEVKAVQNDYDGPGMNHFAFGAAAQADVDAVVTWLEARHVAPLFETPRHRPEFAAGADQTYYQVMFETPDRILIEVVYTGPIAA